MTGGGLDGEEPQDSDGVTRKNVEEWKRYFNEHVEQFVAAHEAIIRKAQQFDTEPSVREALEKVIIASMLPEHKETDAEFMRGSIRLANEYARIALAALAQSDAEPVAWRWRWQSDPPNVWKYADYGFQAEHLVLEPLYAAPPLPDASAGLIDAAVLERYAQSIAMWCYREDVTDHERLSCIANHPITRKYANRAPAADRSTK